MVWQGWGGGRGN
ncbi:hypothetical protein ECFRIK1997_5929, partial [Escherichia coli FRIK1997]